MKANYTVRGRRITSLRQIPTSLRSPKMIKGAVGFIKGGIKTAQRFNSIFKRGKKK